MKKRCHVCGRWREESFLSDICARCETIQADVDGDRLAAV